MVMIPWGFSLLSSNAQVLNLRCRPAPTYLTISSNGSTFLLKRNQRYFSYSFVWSERRVALCNVEWREQHVGEETLLWDAEPFLKGN